MEINSQNLAKNESNQIKKHSKKSPIENQFLALVHVYICNYVVSIYRHRNIEQLHEIVDTVDAKGTNKHKHPLTCFCDDFILLLPQVQSIIRPVSSPKSHGWLRVDVYLKNPRTVVERWYFIHTPLPQNQLPEMNDFYKYELFHRIKTITRSLNSLLQCMPGETLLLSLSHFSRSSPTEENSPFSVELTPLSDFPVVEPHVPHSATLTVRDIVGPFGTFNIRCVYNKEIEELLPRFEHLPPVLPLSQSDNEAGISKANYTARRGSDTKLSASSAQSQSSLTSSSECSPEMILKQSEYQKLASQKKEEEYKAPQKLEGVLSASNEALNSVIESIDNYHLPPVKTPEMTPSTSTFTPNETTEERTGDTTIDSTYDPPTSLSSPTTQTNESQSNTKSFSLITGTMLMSGSSSQQGPPTAISVDALRQLVRNTTFHDSVVPLQTLQEELRLVNIEATDMLNDFDKSG